MKLHSGHARMARLPAALAALLLASVNLAAVAADWRPTRGIEIIVGVAAGGPLDDTARLMQNLLQKNIGVPLVVLNKPGGQHVIAMNYLNQNAGNAHYISMALPNLLTNRIVGVHPLTYTDVTPLALLTSEYLGISVRADSPLKTAQELIAKLRADPASVSFAITGRASGSHIAAASMLNGAGIDVSRILFVPYKGGAETTVAVLGGHVDVVMATPGSALKYIQSGRMRMLAIAAPKRLSGDAAHIPTWKELGVNVVVSNWRAVVGPKGLTAAQVGYWDETLRTMVKSAEWQDVLKRAQWEDEYLNSAQTVEFMRDEYKKLEVLLTSLGEAKK